MASTFDSDASLADATARRRSRLMQRMGLGAAAGLILTPVLGWLIAGGWAFALATMQALETWVFHGRASGLDRRDPIRRALEAPTILLHSVVFAAVAIPLTTIGGAMGAMCAIMILVAGIIYSAVSARTSARDLILGLTPQAMVLGLLPVFMARDGADSNLVTALSVTIVLFLAYAVGLWSRLCRTHRQQRDARTQAEAGRREAQVATAARETFLATVGHDLRTPIGAILSGAEALQHASADPAAQSRAALISDAALMMKAMLDDLLDHAKLNAGRMTVEAVDYDLRELLIHTARFWEGPIKAKGLKLRLDGAHGLPEAVRGDPLRLRQVLNNLISNALKFTEVGRITLSIRSWVEDDGRQAMVIAVTDTGPGLAPEQLDRLFTPFDQTQDGVSAAHGGTGLGLSISRDLVELMGGRLTVRSQLGQGATFTLSLLLDPAESRPTTLTTDDWSDPPMPVLGMEAYQPAPSAPEPSVPEPSAPTSEPEPQTEDRPIRVLVVDDHPINRRAVELILQPLGCDIAGAETGLAALKMCETDLYDVIFMDVRMPELDGRETTRRLRAGGGPNAQTPVVAVTADTSPADIKACLAAGMDRFVPKPLTPQSLLGELQAALSEPRDAAQQQADEMAA